MTVKFTYYPPGIHKRCKSSPFSNTFTVWTPEGSNRLGARTGRAMDAFDKNKNLPYFCAKLIYLQPLKPDKQLIISFQYPVPKYKSSLSLEGEGEGV